ncbi:MAG TPA: SDR family NAD(P)-dependent oxidoreductase [Polyangiaceae bacterium]
MPQPTILLTGASGTIGRHAAVALAAAGFHVRGLTRSARKARALSQAGRPELNWPDFEWVEGDMESPSDIQRALAGSEAAIYLHHAVGESRDYTAREARSARLFQLAADEAGVRRIVYLGGIVPLEHESAHLESRRVTGEILRTATATTIELRATMVIGCNSASFSIIRDLAVQLPVLALPAWLDNYSCPVAICDVAAAIALAAILPQPCSSWFDLPGPQRLTHRDLIEHLTVPLGTRVLDRRIARISPRLAAFGVSIVSRVSPSLSRELILGLNGDLTPNGPVFWDRLGQPTLRALTHAIVDALADESVSIRPSPETRRRIARKTLEWLERIERG